MSADAPSTGNPRRDAFCDEYVVDHNGGQAAVRAGYSENTARQQASKLLTDGNVQARIAALERARLARLQLSADRVLAELAMLAGCNIQDFYTEDGRLKAPHELTREQAAAVKEVDPEGGYKLHDKRMALVDIGKHLGLFDERLRHMGPDGGPVQVQRVAYEIVDPAGGEDG